MLQLLEANTKVVVDIDELWVTCVRHSVVTDKHHIHNIRQIPRFKGVVYIPSESIDFKEHALMSRR